MADTDIPLKEHLLALIAEADKRYSQRFEAQESASKYVQEKTNEFRGALDDIGKLQMPRTEAEAGYKANAAKIDAITERMNRLDGRSTGLNAGWAYLAGAIGLLAALAAIAFQLLRK